MTGRELDSFVTG